MAVGTFDPALGTRRDEARHMLGDTGADSTPFLLDDVTIDAKLLRYVFNEAVAQLADGLATRFAQEPDWLDDEGGINVRWTHRVTGWERLSARLRKGEPKTEIAITGGSYLSGMLSMPDPVPLRSPSTWVPGLRI